MRTDCQTFTVRREGVGTQLVALELPRYRGGLLQIEQLDTAIEQRCSEMAATGIERQQARRCTGSAQGPRAAGDGKITELDRAAVRSRRQPATLRAEGCGCQYAAISEIGRASWRARVCPYV